MRNSLLAHKLSKEKESSCQMENSMKVSGMQPQISAKVKDTRFGVMEVSMKVSGLMTKQTAEEDLSMPMVTFTKDCGKTIKPTATVFICTTMGQSTKDTGKTINSTGKEKNNGLTVQSMKATTSKE